MNYIALIITRNIKCSYTQAGPMTSSLFSIIVPRKEKREESLKEHVLMKASFQSHNINYLAHIHAISNFAADRTNSRERSLKRRRMTLCIPSALKSTGIRGGIISIELSPNSSNSLFFSLRKGKNLAADPAK